MRSVLVVWEEFPEKSSFIKLAVREKDYELLKTFHNQFVNSTSSNDEICDQICKFFYDEKGHLKFEQFDCILENEKYDLIIKSGMMM